MKWLLALFLALLPTGLSAQGRDPILVPEISQHEIRVRQGFTGTELLLYGAILDPRGQQATADYDIVVVLKGPSRAVRVREKERVGGIWVNAESVDMRSVPSFYALASSRPIADIVGPRTAAIYELGVDYLQLSPTGRIDPEEQQRFSTGLVELRRKGDLYQQDEGGVTISSDVLYQARIALPSTVLVGNYTAETFAIANGRVIASATADVEVVKEGFERVVADRAEDSPFLYGLFAIFLSLFMGWAAGRLFQYV